MYMLYGDEGVKLWENCQVVKGALGSIAAMRISFRFVADTYCVVCIYTYLLCKAWLISIVINAEQ